MMHAQPIARPGRAERIAATFAVIGSVLFAAFGVVAFTHPSAFARGREPLDAVAFVAGFVGARNLVLAAMTIVAVARRDRKMLADNLLMLGLIQVLDLACHLRAHEGLKALGPAVFALLALAASRAFSGRLARPTMQVAS